MKVPILCLALGRALGGIKVATGVVLSGSALNRPQVEEMRVKCQSPPARGIALIQVKLSSAGIRPISKQNRAHIQEEEPALLDEGNDTHSRGSLALGPVKPTSPDGIIHILGITPDDLCPARGDNAGLGCAVGCRCGWWKQCYPKTMLVVHSGQRSNGASQDAASRIHVGVCDLAPPVLVLLSVFILLGAILFFAVAKFVAMLPGHYGLEPRHREVHKPQHSQVEERMGWRNPHPPTPADDLRSFQLQKDDKTHDTQEVEVWKDRKRRQQAVSSGASSTESPVLQTATVPVIPNIIVTKPGTLNDEPHSGAL